MATAARAAKGVTVRSITGELQTVFATGAWK